MHGKDSNSAPLGIETAREEAAETRVCLPTTRAVARNTFRAGSYEAEDVLVECADAHLLRLEQGRHPRLRSRLSRLQWSLLDQGVSLKVAHLNPALRSVELTGEYDLLLLVCPLHADALAVNAVRGWKERCKTSVCWISEWWAGQVPRQEGWLPLLREFDHVVVGMRGSVDAVRRALGRQCHYVPGGAVDALRFSPFPDPVSRVIDVYSIGRRLEGVHRSLLHLSASQEIFYVHDTIDDFARAETWDPRAHRDLYATMAKRSRFFTVAPAMMDNRGLTGGQVEIGFRYYEGAAAGAVLVGQAPDCEAFRRQFDWPDSVIDLRPDGSDTARQLAGLLADRERMAAISRRNAVAALLQHDWVYRWKEIFALAGRRPTAKMLAREARLKELARLAAAGALDVLRAKQPGQSPVLA